MTSAPQTIEIQLENNKKAFFASDFHLGAPDIIQSKDREKKLVEWMRTIRQDTGALFLVGDLFDFWFEYKHVIPKGFTRFLAELGKFVDEGIPVYIFTGNHDIWMFDYLQNEIGAHIIYQPTVFIINGTKYYVGHGDGLGPGDKKFKFLKKVFTFPIFQKMFSWIHPDIGISIAQAWSNRSRTDPATEKFEGEENERLWVYTREIHPKVDASFYIFGHRHLPLDMKIGENARYINLGDWLYNYTYLEMNGMQVELKKFVS